MPPESSLDMVYQCLDEAMAHIRGIAIRHVESDGAPAVQADGGCWASTGGARKRKRSGNDRQAGGKRARKKTNGYVDVPRDAHRGLHGRTAFVDGNERSCSQDALVNGAKALGVAVTKKQVHTDTLPAEGDTEVGVIVDYARVALGIEMLDTRDPSTLGYSLFQAKGGPAHALLQLTEGVFFVELTVSQDDKPDDYHALMYNANYTADPKETAEKGWLVRGAIIDNEKDTPIKLLEASDRAMVFDPARGKEVPAARKVFDSLFPFASAVRVVGAWLMHKA